MVNKCACVNCKSGYKGKEDNITLHKFPLQNPDLLKQWLAKISRKNFTPTIHSRVCSLHFMNCDFVTERLDSNKHRKHRRGNRQASHGA